MSAILFFSSRGDVVDVLIGEGESDSLPLPVKGIVERATSLGTPRLLVSHTHPSGDPRPSEQDLIATRQLCSKLRPRGILLADHIILAPHSYFSFRMHRLL